VAQAVHDEWDSKLVASLARKLGQGYDIHYPRMPNEADPNYLAWKSALQHEIRRPRRHRDSDRSLRGRHDPDPRARRAGTRAKAGQRLADRRALCRPRRMAERRHSNRSRISALDCRKERLSIFIMAAKMRRRPARMWICISKPSHRRRVRKLAGRDHQLNDDLSEVAADIETISAG
jgi:hypothetical protein